MTNRGLQGRSSRTTAAAVVLLAVVASLLPAPPVRAASSVDMQLRALVGGRYAPGGWAAVAVTLVNDGEPTEGNLVAETDGGTVQRFVELPSGAAKVVTLYVEPEAFQRRITVTYQEPNGAVEAEVEVRVLEQGATQVAVIGDGGGNIRPQLAAALSEETAPEALALGTADLPDRPEPLEGISTIVWAADSSALTEGQRRSVERWVASGGTLVVLGGADWQARTSAFADLLPITNVAAVDDAAVDALAAWAGVAGTPSEGETVATGELREGADALVRGDDDAPLLSMRAIGAGRAIFLGADLATADYRNWDGSPRIWERLTPASSNLGQFFGGGLPVDDEARNAISQALGNLPSLEVPPAELLLGLVVAYIVLIGPLSYLVLRRMDRREAAWITAPALVIAFSVASYAIGSSLKGTEVITNQIALVRTGEAGGTATVQTYAGVFSPDRSSYDVRVDADALLAPVEQFAFDGRESRGAAVTIEQGNPARLRDLAIGVFGFQAVEARAIVPYEPALSISWRNDDGDLIGTVTNNGDVPLSDVAYVSTSGGEMIGDLAPGAQAEFEVPRVNFNGSSASDQVYGFGGFDGADEQQRETLSRRQVIDALVGYGGMLPPGVELPSSDGRGPFVIGWRDDGGPVPVTLDGAAAQEYAQAVEVLSVRRPIGTGEVTIGPAQMSVAVIATDGDVSSGGPGMLFIGEGSATYSITLPLEASNMDVEELKIVVAPDPSMVLGGDFGGGGFWPQGFKAEVRDPGSGEWRELGDLSQASSFEIDDPPTAMSAAGRIEVRFTGVEANPNFGQSSVFVSAQATGVIDR